METLMKKIATVLATLIASSLMMITNPVIAHDPESNPGKPQHGGQYVEYEQHYGIELVHEDGNLVFHMTMHLEPRDMSGSAFQVIVLSDGETKSLTAKVDDSTLIANAGAPLKAGDKVVLSGKDRDGDPLQARFVIE
jgi:hypothetical protein